MPTSQQVSRAFIQAQSQKSLDAAVRESRTEYFPIDPVHAKLDIYNPKTGQEIVHRIWREKYSTHEEEHPNDTFTRVASALYPWSHQKDPDADAGIQDPGGPKAYEALCKNLWVPGGRILASIGTKHRTTAMNCYVLSTMEDSMSGIMEVLRQTALTMQQGGGIGVDFSKLRPEGAHLVRTNAPASGPLPFMDTWDACCRTIMSAGSRRGAMMATLHCEHPDLPKFITAKHEEGRLTNFNVSVLITDAFMSAVEDDEDWYLGHECPKHDGSHLYCIERDDDDFQGRWYAYSKWRARELWDMILQNTYEWAEPGVIFIDRVNKENNLKYCETINCTNPCVTGDTQVLTDKGHLPIESLVGKKVNVWNGSQWSEVVPFSTGVNPLYEVSLTNGHTIRCTPKHRWYLSDGSVTTTDKLQEKDKLIYCDMPRGVARVEHRIRSVEKLNGQFEETFCLTEPLRGMFIANGVPVGNCGEQPLPPDGCCNLGAVNLARMVKRPFTDSAELDMTLLKDVVTLGVDFLDRVIDETGYPLEMQLTEELNKRRIGLGVMGLANALAQLGIKYNSVEAFGMTERIMEQIAHSAYEASCELARVKGPFPRYDADNWGNTSLVKNLPKDLRNKIKEHGIRNGVLLTIAPTGTTAILSGYVSGGLEPVFAHTQKRYVRGGMEEPKDVFLNYDYGYLIWCAVHGKDPADVEGNVLPAYMVEHDQIGVEDHIEIQAICQTFVDASISKTVNCPKEMSFEDFRAVYAAAYDRGCKGCTTYRPSGVRGAVLEKVEPAIDVNKGADGAGGVQGKPKSRPEVLYGPTYTIKWGDHKYLLTINDEDGKPREVLVHSTTSQYTDWTTTVCLLLSLLMKVGVDIAQVAAELKKVASTHDSAWVKGKRYASFSALIGEYLLRHANELAGGDDNDAASGDEIEVPEWKGDPLELQFCQSCGQMAVFVQEGCETCTACGWSRCG